MREGYYASKSMIDMVESERQQNERTKKIAAENHNPDFADVTTKWRDSIPKEDRPRRLVSDSDYEDRMKEVTGAEHTAQVAKRGIWSADAHRNEGEISRKSKEPFPVRDLYVHGVNAHRMDDADVYCLIGGDFCLTTLGPIVPEDQVDFISIWLSQHPSAIATPISNESFKVMRDQPPIHGTYIWIKDGKESLDLALVRNGYYGAHALTDMVEARQQFDESMKASGLSDARATMAKERAEEAAPQRLINDQDYKLKMRQANIAEHDAEIAQVGIWSPSEIVHWKPPSDAAMIDVYAKHRRLAGRQGLETGAGRPHFDRHHGISEMGRRSIVNGVSGFGADRIQFDFELDGVRYRPTVKREPTEATFGVPAARWRTSSIALPRAGSHLLKSSPIIA